MRNPFFKSKLTVSNTLSTRFLSFFLPAVFLFTILGTFTSCKDYDDDISDLQKKYDNLSALVSSLQQKIDAGSVITSLDPISNGVVLTLSDGQTYTITNGKDGAKGEKGDKGDTGEKGDTGNNGINGILYTIGTDGYWYADGIKTDNKAIGADGVQGPKGDKGDDGLTWTIGTDGYWYLDGARTQYKAVGTDGAKGDKGETGASGKDGILYTIGTDGYWYADGVRTSYKAIGEDGGQGPKGETGANGKDGILYTIGTDGYWYADGVRTDYKAVGENGTNGTDSTIVINGDYYVPNPASGNFDRYVWNEATGKYEATATDIPYLADGTITAVMESGSLSLYGVKDGSGNDAGTVVITLTPAVSNASIVSGGAMTFKTSFVSGSVFGSGVADNPIRFYSGSQSLSASVLVLVNPSSAVLKAGNIHLINTAGKEIGEVYCSSVRRYTNVDTRAVESNLWVVTFSLKPGLSESAFERVTGGEDGKVIYAVSISCSDNDSDSRVTTDYSVTLGSENNQYTGAYTVNGTSVADIHNRYLTTESGVSTADIAELVWKTGSKPSSVADNGNSVNRPSYGYTDATRDNRQNMPLLEVKVGDPLTIAYPGTSTVKGFYVMTDRDFAIEDYPTELRQWCGYGYDNVGIKDYQGNVTTKATMFVGKEGTIKVTSLGSGSEDIIGFRVFAVNDDGTLVDPDGVAFYVHVSAD